MWTYGSGVDKVVVVGSGFGSNVDVGGNFFLTEASSSTAGATFCLLPPVRHH